MRDRDRDTRQLLGEDRRRAPLVDRIEIGEEERHRDRLHAAGGERPRGGPHGGLIERHQHLAARAEPLGDLQATSAGHERRRPSIEHVVHAQEVAAPDLEDITEAFSGEESGASPLPLEQGIDADCRAVDRQPTVGEVDAGLICAPQDAVQQLGGCAEGLGVDHGARRLVERHEVREGPTDVDADSEWHPGSFGAAVYLKHRRDGGGRLSP